MKKIRSVTALMLCAAMICSSGCADKASEGTQSEAETTTVSSAAEGSVSSENKTIEELFSDGIEINGKKYTIPMYMEDFGDGYSWSDDMLHPDLIYNGKTIASISLKDDTNEISVLTIDPEYEYKYGEIYEGNTREKIEAACGKPEDGYEIMGIRSVRYSFGNSYISLMYQDDILLGIEFWLNMVPEGQAVEMPDLKEKAFSIKNDVLASVYINGIKMPTNINDMPDGLVLNNQPMTLIQHGKDVTMDAIMHDGEMVTTLAYDADSGEITGISADNITNTAEIEVYGISMGDSPEKVIEILGEPDEKVEEGIAMYTYMEENLSALLITFTENKVASITISLAE